MIRIVKQGERLTIHSPVSWVGVTEHTDYTDCCTQADRGRTNRRMSLGVVGHVDHGSLPEH